MFVLSTFTLFLNGRKTGIASKYRPDWDGVCDCFCCAQVTIPNDVKVMEPGKTFKVLLQPLSPDLWENVQVGHILIAYEGPKQVGLASVDFIFGP